MFDLCAPKHGQLRKFSDHPSYWYYNYLQKVFIHLLLNFAHQWIGKGNNLCTDLNQYCLSENKLDVAVVA